MAFQVANGPVKITTCLPLLTSRLCGTKKLTASFFSAIADSYFSTVLTSWRIWPCQISIVDQFHPHSCESMYSINIELVSGVSASCFPIKYEVFIHTPLLLAPQKARHSYSCMGTLSRWQGLRESADSSGRTLSQRLLRYRSS